MQEKVHEVDFKDLFFPFTNVKAIIWIIVVGLVVYFNSFFNGFILDDIAQIVQNTQIHSISNIVTFFQGSTFSPDKNFESLQGVYYKPLMTTTFSLIYTIFGENAFFFHFFQVVLHIINAILVYLLFLRFFQKKLAFFLSLLFLVHPINVESVAFISSLQEVLFFAFGMLSLLLAFNQQKLHTQQSKASYIILYILLLCSILSKETGIVFIIILPLFSLLFQRKNILGYTVVAFLSLVTYLLLRFFVGHIYFNESIVYPLPALLVQRLIIMPKIIWFYIQTFFVPVNLIFWQSWIVKQISFKAFYLPILLDSVFLILILILGIFVWRENKTKFSIFLFFIFWFLIGIGLHLQIFPLDMTVADRWFYFPIVGLLGLIGICISYIKLLSPYAKFFSMLLVVAVILLLSVRTMVRNTNWIDTFTLFSNDSSLAHNYIMELYLGENYFEAKNYNEALKHFMLSEAILPIPLNTINIGITYDSVDNKTKAKEYYMKVLDEKYSSNMDKIFETAYESTSKILVYNENPKQSTIYFIEKGLKKYPNSVPLLVALSYEQYQLHNNSEAVLAVKKAYGILPIPSIQYMLTQMTENQPIDLKKFRSL